MRSRQKGRESGAHVQVTSPNRDALRFFERAITVFILLIGVVVVGEITHSIESSMVRGLAFLWIGTTLAVSFLRLFVLRQSNPLNWQSRIQRITPIGIFLVGAFHLTVILESQRLNLVAPTLIWVLYLLPALVVSDIDRHSQEWAKTIALSLLTYLSLSIFALFRFNEVPVSAQEIVAIGGNTFLLLLIAGLFHIVAAQRRASESMLEEMQRLSAALQEVNVIEDVFTRVAEQISVYFKKLRPMVHILRADEANKHLYVVGSTGLKDDVWKNIKIPFGKYVTGRAFLNQEPEYAQDINQPDIYGDVLIVKGMEKIKAELALPIHLNNEIVGVLDLATEVPAGFVGQDIVAARAWANNVALGINHAQVLERSLEKQREEQNKKFSTVLRGIMNAGGDNRTVAAWFKSLREVLHTHVEHVSEVLLLPLAPGTGYPIFPLLHSLDEPTDPRLERIANLRLESNPQTYLWELLNNWEITEWNKQSHWEEWGKSACNGSNLDSSLVAILSESEIESFVAIPIGAIESPTAIVFLCFDKDVGLTEVRKFFYTAIGSAIEISYGEVRASNQEKERIMEATHKDLKEIAILADKIRVNGSDKLHELTSDIEARISNVRIAIQHLDLFDFAPGNTFYDLLKEMVINNGFNNRLKLTYPSSEALEFVDDESIVTRQAILRVIQNALENACEHGKATRATISILRTGNSINVEITNDGECYKQANWRSACKRAAERERSRWNANGEILEGTTSFGIAYLRTLYWKTMRATISLRPYWESITPGLHSRQVSPDGTRVILTLPTWHV